MNNIKQISPQLTEIKNYTPALKIDDKYFVNGIGGNFVPSGAGSMDFYKCASVDTTNHIWTGYKAIFNSTTGIYSFQETATTGLTYGGGFTPSINGIYTDGALVSILTAPTPEGSSNVITPVGDAEFGFRNNMGTSFFVNSYGTWLNNDTRSDWGVSGGTVFRTSTVADVGGDWHGTAGNNSFTNFFLWWTINRETVVKGYQCMTLENQGYGMTEWVLQGSNDGSTWTTIHTGTASAPSDNSKIRYFSTSSNSTAYLCYRIKPVSINIFPFVGFIRAFSEDIGEVYLEPQSN